MNPQDHAQSLVEEIKRLKQINSNLLEALKEAVEWIKNGPDLDSPKAQPKLNKLEQASKGRRE